MRGRARPGLRRRVGVATALIVLSSALALACEPFQRYAASAIVVAPNRDVPLPSPRAGEMQVPVGPPAATLAVEIVDARTPSAPRATVFVLHGIRADRRSVRGWADMLAAAGFRAVLVDLRGHGRSTGDFLSYGVVEARDLAQVLDALDARGMRAGPAFAMGYSYGAATAIEWAGNDPRVRAVVAVAPFASLRAVAPGYAILPFSASFVNGAVDMAGRAGGFDPDAASPLAAAERTHAALLLIHGDDDSRIPAWHSQRIAAAAGDHAEIVLVPGAGHRSIVDAAVIGERVPAWFAQRVGR